MMGFDQRIIDFNLSLTLLFFCFLSSLLGKEPLGNSQYPSATLVIYNQNVGDSRKLAAYYAGKRNVPFENLIGLKCSTEEIITRSEYKKTILEPLRKQFDANGWWERKKDSQGNLRAVHTKMKFAAIMFGMPLKIQSTVSDSSKQKSSTYRGPGENDAASIDSEVACFNMDFPRLNGPVINPYFRSTDPGGTPDILLTSRIDGPNYVTAKRLIDDAIAVEESGLWGMALIDIANLHKEKGAAYKIGDDWLETCNGFYQKAGIPTLVDRFSARVPKGFPLGKDIILYFGWYTQNAQGPFVDPAFQFKRGAVAAHIHSYSASTLRTTLKNWSGPLLSRGACAVLGNVYEPFLQMSTHLDLFNARFLAGFTFAEAGWIATPVFSWMQVMIGDPLYQPFIIKSNIEAGKDDDYKAFSIAVLRWASEPEKLISNLDKAAASLKSGKILEATGLLMMSEGKYKDADEMLKKASLLYTNSEDQLRVCLLRAQGKMRGGDKVSAMEILSNAVKDFKGSPGIDAVRSISEQMKKE
ncbi:MAG TPA: hypothetical protein DCE22_09990 [Verrucomicrobiales bacterium]|nr:hypothetical protein [Verrucomicrobiales bacterium]